MSFISKAKCIYSKFWHLCRLNQNNIKSEITRSAACMLRTQHVRFYKHHLQEIRPPPRATIFKPTNPPTIGAIQQSSSDSGYPIYTACLGPFIDNRYWFAETEDLKGNKMNEGLGYTQENDQAGKMEEISLEELRKTLKEKQLGLNLGDRLRAPETGPVMQEDVF